MVQNLRVCHVSRRRGWPRPRVVGLHSSEQRANVCRCSPRPLERDKRPKCCSLGGASIPQQAMAMLRRLHVLGAKDPAAQLLRSLTTRSNNNNNNTATTAADEQTNGTAGAPLQQRNHRLGAIGPASKSRYAFGSGSSPNRGLSGLAGTSAWIGNDAINGGVGASRSLSSGSEPR